MITGRTWLQRSAHRNSELVPLLDEAWVIAEWLVEVPTAKHAHGNSGTTGSERFPAAERLEDRVARFLLRPDRCETARVEDDSTGLQHAAPELFCRRVVFESA